MQLNSAGDTYGSFTLKKILPLKELNCVFREIVHTPSGAEIIHIENDDPENLFCLSFRTLPTNSNGVAHILEHVVLCGSHKFPIKDPFFSMTRRSLNTFMNALTGADFTCYPAASQVEKDFYNLFEVYLDAVFHPQLKKMSFLQEGRRLSFTDPENPDSPLEWKGVVYNEMKGSLSSPDSRLWHRMMEELVPDLTYAHNSGGNPQEIPSLSYEELLSFYNTYYDPSRCLFFLYGNLPLKGHLDFIESHTLKNATKKEPLAALPTQKRFLKPKSVVGEYPIAASENTDQKDLIAFGWLTTSVKDQDILLALSVLDVILMETDASPLKFALLQSGLCLSTDAILETEMSEVPYLILCKGCRKEDADALEKVLKEALKKVCENPLPLDLIEAAVHQIEFSRTEITGDTTPFGLTLFFRSALAKQHGCIPEHSLLIHSLFERFREKIKDPSYLPSLIRKYLLSNTHSARLVLSPSKTLAGKEEEEEKAVLKKIQESLSVDEKERILEETKALERYQKELEGKNLDILPRVTLNDVPILVRDFKLSHHANVFSHTCFTNQILYADLVYDLPHFQEQDLPYVQLLTLLTPELGAGSRGYVENLEYLQAYTGGLGASLSLNIQAGDPLALKPAFTLRGKALKRNIAELFKAMKETLLHLRLDEPKRIEELILQIHTSLQNRLNKNALRYASQLALSGFSPVAKINELWHGLSFLKKIEEIVEKIKEGKLDLVVEKLRQIHARLFSYKNPHLVIACDPDILRNLEKEKFYGLLDLPHVPTEEWKTATQPKPVISQARPIASPVAFTCLAYRACSLLNPHSAGLYVAAQLMENKILFPAIREQGGAYGCGATYSASMGLFTLHSFRDPHLFSTLQSFEHAIKAVAKGSFDNRDLEEAKLGIIQNFDAPIAPGSRASVAYHWLREGKSKETRQHLRQAILELNQKDIARAVEKELLTKKDENVAVTFAGETLLEKENRIFRDNQQKPLPIIPI